MAENIGFRLFDRHPFTFLKALVSGRALRKNASSLIVEYGIRTPGPDAPIGSLSGGNVQRAVLARELSDDAAGPVRNERSSELAPRRLDQVPT